MLYCNGILDFRRCVATVSLFFFLLLVGAGCLDSTTVDNEPGFRQAKSSYSLGDKSIKAVAFGNDRYVAVGENVILVSADGDSWEIDREPILGKRLYFTTISYDEGAGRFIVSGPEIINAEGDWSDTSLVISSSDGKHWRPEPIREDAGNGSSLYSSMAGGLSKTLSNNGVDFFYVLVNTKGDVYLSEAIEASAELFGTWRFVDDSIVDVDGYAVSSAMDPKNKRLVVIGKIDKTGEEGEEIIVRERETREFLEDGASDGWRETEVTSQTHRLTDIKDISCNEGLCVIVGPGGAIRSERNGEWKAYENLPANEEYRAVSIAGNRIVIAGNKGGEPSHQTIYASNDKGASWRFFGSTGVYATDISYGDDVFIIVGDGGGIGRFTAGSGGSSDGVKQTVEYTVTFDPGAGGTDAQNMPGAQTVVEDGLVSAPQSAPTRDGYDFDGWYKERSGATKWDFGRDKITQDTTLYAKWSLKSSVEYTVTFDPGGGVTDAQNMPGAQTVVEDGLVSAPQSAPTRDGYDFDGWYKERSGATKWDFGRDKITQDTTLYAKWSLKFSFSSEPAPYTPLSVGAAKLTDGSVQIESGAALSADYEISYSGDKATFTLEQDTNMDGVFDSVIDDSDKFEVDKAAGKLKFKAGLGSGLYRLSVTQHGAAQYYHFDIAPTLYVDAVSSEGGSGSDWENAYHGATNLQALLDAAADAASTNNTAIIIKMKGGTYKPTASDNKWTNFSMKSKARIYGGYSGEERAGVGATAGSIEAIQGDSVHRSIFSGDLLDDDERNARDDNIHRVFAHYVAVDSSALLSGALITAGNGESGSGMYNGAAGAAPTLSQVVFSGNSAGDGKSGGGMYNAAGAAPTLGQVVFSGNSAGSGGGMYNEASESGAAGAAPTLSQVIFSGNSAGYGKGGGGMYNGAGAAPTLNQVVFSANNAGYGGGMYNWNASPVLVGATFFGNSAVSSGNAIESGSDDASATTLINALLLDDATAGGYDGGIQHTNAGGKNSLRVYYSLASQGGDDSAPRLGGPSLGNQALAVDAGALKNIFVDFTDPDGPDDKWLTDDDGLRLAKVSDSIVIGKGAYAQRFGNEFCFSVDQTTWREISDGQVSALPAKAQAVSSFDILGRLRVARPDIGAYEVD